MGNLQCLWKDSQLRAVPVLGQAYEFLELVERLVKRVLLTACLDDRGAEELAIDGHDEGRRRVRRSAGASPCLNFTSSTVTGTLLANRAAVADFSEMPIMLHQALRIPVGRNLHQSRALQTSQRFTPFCSLAGFSISLLEPRNLVAAAEKSNCTLKTPLLCSKTSLGTILLLRSVTIR